ncbi:hypothetical protein IFM89_034231 [Coptis chinensis]|uniref:Uncharacterized protein n=1 Tax=Coptis chinensis TaxID=261450 RepID=A0A835LK66_9MAGN|nr:hypothetical protein IFM89_034231 [Coptis chinensis]
MKEENVQEQNVQGLITSCSRMSHCPNENVQGSISPCSSYPVPSSPEPCMTLLDNPQLFYKILREFHDSSGLRLISCAASSVLDLYLFYKQVTMRGGFAQVTKDRRWSEVASALNFSNGSPQPSVLLQNLYANLLFQFELIIIGSGAQGKMSIHQGSPLVSTPIKEISPDHASSSENWPTSKRKHPTSPNQSYRGFSPDSYDPGDQVGQRVSGMIETEIECGYLISVTVGTEKLNGVLYHLKDTSVEQFAVVPSLVDGVLSEDSGSEPIGLKVLVGSTKQEAESVSSPKKESHRKSTLASSSKDESKTKPTSKFTSKKQRKEQDAPRGTRSAYQFFISKECERLKKKHGKNQKVRHMVSDAWKALPERDRLPYIEASKKDKERFTQEMIAYNERKTMKSSKAGFRIFDSEPSIHEFHNDYCVSLEMEEVNKHHREDAQMVGVCPGLMKKSQMLDVSLQIELDDEFLSVH